MNNLILLAVAILFCFTLVSACRGEERSSLDTAVIKRYQGYEEGRGRWGGERGVSYCFPKDVVELVIEHQLANEEGFSPAHIRSDPKNRFYLSKCSKTLRTDSAVFCENYVSFFDGVGIAKGRLIDESGRFISENYGGCPFRFKNGRANFIRYEKYTPITAGSIDKNGKLIFSNPQYSRIDDYSEEMVGVLVRSAAKYGYADLSGKLVIEPNFKRVDEFHDGLALVVADDKIGFIDKAGVFLIKPTYEAAKSFSEGLAAVEVAGKWGFINKDQKLVIEPQFQSVGNFSEGLAAVQPYSNDSKKPEAVGYIDHNGRYVISPRFVLAKECHFDIARVWDSPETDRKTQLVLFASGFITPALPLAGVERYIDKEGHYLDGCREPMSMVGDSWRIRGAN